jgi:hypothetical protein
MLHCPDLLRQCDNAMAIMVAQMAQEDGVTVSPVTRFGAGDMER